MTIDLTGIAIAVATVSIPAIGAVMSAWVASHMKDKAAVARYQTAINEGLGILQQAAPRMIGGVGLKIPGVPDALAPGVQHVLDTVADEVKRLGKTPVVIAKQLDANIGLKNIETNVAVSGSAVPIVVKPLDPVPVNATALLNQEELARINRPLT